MGATWPSETLGPESGQWAAHPGQGQASPTEGAGEKGLLTAHPAKPEAPYSFRVIHHLSRTFIETQSSVPNKVTFSGKFTTLNVYQGGRSLKSLTASSIFKKEKKKANQSKQTETKVSRRKERITTRRLMGETEHIKIMLKINDVKSGSLRSLKLATLIGEDRSREHSNSRHP